VHKSTNGGATWQDITPATALNRAVHPDMHAIAFDPSNPDIVWVGTDGGIFRSSNGGQTWQQRNGNLSTLQVVNLAVHPSNPNIAFGGLQDNAKAVYNGSAWFGMFGGEVMAAIRPSTPSMCASGMAQRTPCGKLHWLRAQRHGRHV